jgi:raffinose/stachyose/melibiose transport system substrate-binding protein
MKGKKILVLLTVALIAASMFTACKKQDGSQSSGEMVELHVFQHKPYLDEAYKKLAQDFMAENSNVTVTTETIGGGTQWQTILKSKFAANEGPDIFIVEGKGQYELWQDFIADLSGEPWISNALPFTIVPMQIGGKQMGMPLNLEGYGYIYNKDIFEKAGVTSPPKNLSELRAACEKIKASGVTPFATGYATWWVMGLHLLNVAFAQQDNPQAFIDQLNAGSAKIADNQQFKDLENVIKLTLEFGEDNPLTTDHNKQVQMFANGEVAMIQQGVWKETPIFKASPNMNIGLLPVPINDDAKMDRIPVGVPFFFVVNKTASPETQQAAKDFLNFLGTTPTGRKYISEEFKFISAYKGGSSEGLGGVGKDILTYAGQEKTIPWVFGSFPDGFANEAKDYIQAYIAGKQDWATTLTKFDEAWQKNKK